MPSKFSARPRSNAFSKPPCNFFPKKKIQIHKTSTIQEFISLSENIPLAQVTDEYIQEWIRKLSSGGKDLRMKREREREEADDEWGHIYVVNDEEVDRPAKRAKSVNEETGKKNPGEEVPDLDQALNEEDAPEEEAPEEHRNEEMPDSDEEPEENPNEDTREEDETNSEDEPGDGPGVEELGSDEEPEKSDDEKSVPDDDHPHSEDLGSDFNDELNAPEQAPDTEETEPESEEDAHDVEDKPAEGSEVEEEEPIKVEVDDRIWVFCAAKIKTGTRKGMTCGLTPLADGDYVRYCWQHCEDAEPKKYTKKYTEHDAYSCPRNNGHNCGGCWKPEYDDE